MRKCDFFSSHPSWAHCSVNTGLSHSEFRACTDVQIPALGGSTRQQDESNRGVETPPLPISKYQSTQKARGLLTATGCYAASGEWAHYETHKKKSNHNALMLNQQTFSIKTWLVYTVL